MKLRQNARQGFTLIELLVVIAIIAILAAILFPVFQSVRENARAADCVSNQKQIALGVLQYTQDNDEKYPIANYGLPGGGWNKYNLFTIPSTSASSVGTTDFWANSIQTYVKSYAVYQCKDSSLFNIVSQPTSRPSITYTYNGELQSSSQAAVLSPSAVPLIWPGELKDALVGVATASPVLDCPDANAPCVYQPVNDDNTCKTGNGSTSSTIMFSSDPSAFVHHSGDNFAYCDGHVKFVNYTIDPNHIAPGAPAGSPFALLDASGNIFYPDGSYGVYDDYCHTYGFEPDFNP